MLANYAKWYSFTPPQLPNFPPPLTPIHAQLEFTRIGMPGRLREWSRLDLESSDEAGVRELTQAEDRSLIRTALVRGCHSSLAIGRSSIRRVRTGFVRPARDKS